jgi:hypothetical protein
MYEIWLFVMQGWLMCMVTIAAIGVTILVTGVVIDFIQSLFERS